jgi:predicted dehydrogenase
MNRKLKYGMVGGGPGAFIGAVHRSAAALDGEIELVAGAFSSDPAKSREQGEALHLDADRVYGSYEEMAEREAERPEGERIDFVTIVTPNHLHFPVARTFIERGFHVVCDKPMTTSLQEAEVLCEMVESHDVVFALTHNYTGYPLVKHARAMVQGGAIGDVRRIVCEYPQGWLAAPIEEDGDKQASWRTDPSKAGAGALGDIGTHAENLVRYVTGCRLTRLCADVGTVVDGRAVDDDVSMLCRWEGPSASGEVRGVMYASQVSQGEENNLRLRVYGTDGSVDWRQEDPHRLVVRRNGEPKEVHTHGSEYLADAAQHYTRLPPGHPEAFIEAFANVYRAAARTIAARTAGEEPGEHDRDFPTVQDGAAGVHFIETALASGKREAWLDARYTPPGEKDRN